MIRKVSEEKGRKVVANKKDNNERERKGERRIRE